MLLENTGEAMGDSGGAYGRHWQRNQGKKLEDFENSPEVVWEKVQDWYVLKKDGEFIRRDTTEEGLLSFLLTYQPQSTDWAMKHEGYIIEKESQTSQEIEYTISVFHYLNMLDLDDFCDKYNALPCKDWDSDIYGVSKLQKEWLDSKGVKILDSFNTYNGESSLSQVLQGTYISSVGRDTPDYVLLQVHGGCDVRGGYTNAKMFKLPEHQEGMPIEDVYGDIDGVNVSNGYNGRSLTNDEGEAIPVTPESIINLSLSY